MTLRNIDVAILCGGLGTRLGLRTRAVPKLLVPVAGRPFADYLVRFLYRHGARRILFLGGHLHAHIADWMMDSDPGDIAMELIVEETKLGTAGALRRARPRLRTEHVLVCNGDTLTTASIPEFVLTTQERQVSVTELFTKRFGHENMFHTGFSLYTAKALDELAADDEADLVAWNRWRSWPIFLPGQYLDLGDPRQYKRAQKIFPLWEPLS